MVSVKESAVIDVPIEEVWHWLRDFNSHKDWHPAIADSHIEGDLPPDTVGAVRSFTLTDGGALREQLIRLDDNKRELSYCLIDSPLPLYDYVAEIRLKPVTDGARTFWQWESKFNPPPDRASELKELVARGIYRAGMRALERYLRARHAGRQAPVEVRRVNSYVDRKPVDQVPHSAVASSIGRMEMARAIVMDRHGGPEVLSLREIEVGPPGPGEVRIRQSHIGVNFIDVYSRTGYFDLIHPPGIPGMEAAGIVDAVGPGVSHLRPGDRVAYACPPPGAYTSIRCMNADLVISIPSWLSSEKAAAGMLKGITAGFLLHDVRQVKRGETIVVHAAAGGVGSLLVQWATALGARVIATVSSPEKARIAEALGADDVVIGRGHDFVDRVMELTSGRGADAIYDAIGRDAFDASLAALAIRGQLISFGQASGDIGAREIGPLASKSVTLSRPNYGHYIADRPMMELQASRLFEALERRMLEIPDPSIAPLADAARVHADLEAGRTTGAIVLSAIP